MAPPETYRDVDAHAETQRPAPQGSRLHCGPKRVGDRLGEHGYVDGEREDDERRVAGR